MNAQCLEADSSRRPTGTAYFSEDDLLYQDAFAFVDSRFPSSANLAFPASSNVLDIRETTTYQWPSHLVLFDELLHRRRPDSGQDMHALIKSKGYIELKRFWNSLVHEDPRRSGDVVVLVHDSVKSS